MTSLKEHIDLQFETNRKKNLFFHNLDSVFDFIDGTDTVSCRLKVIDKNEESQLIEYIANKALEEFCNFNQYYSFDSDAKEELKKLYTALFEAIRETPYDLKKVSGTLSAAAKLVRQN